MPWNTGLDPASAAYAIAGSVNQRVRVVAGPGTGKSFAMKRRVAKLLEDGVDPKKILPVTFTRVAADDLHRELQKLDAPGLADLKGVTLHSLAMRILRRAHVFEALGRVPRPLNRFEMQPMISDLVVASMKRRETSKHIRAYESAWAQTQGQDVGYAKTAAEQAFQARLLAWLNFHGAMLIGELIPYLVRYLHDNPAAQEHSEFEHLLVDEFQDLNKAEQAVIGYLGANARVCIVGDDDQSIYSFKHAFPDGIREWRSENPSCDDLEMGDCHRCPTTIVAMANSLIAHNTDREDRELSPVLANGPGVVSIIQLADVGAEAAYIANKVFDLLENSIHPNEIIVLVQRRIVAKPIRDALREKEVPVKSYYDESEIDTDLAQLRFALLKLLVSKTDRVALRFLLGLGSQDHRAKSYARVRARCEETGEEPWAALEMLAAGDFKLPYTAALIDQFKIIQSAMTELEPVKDNIPALIDTLFPDDVSDLAEVRELSLEVAEEASNLQEFFDALVEALTQPEVPLTVEDVRVMSLHKSKGLSSPFVFIAGCVEGVLPQGAPDDATPAQKLAHFEEARRLFYVGLTRVKAEPAAGRPGTLFLTYPRQMEAGKAYGAAIKFTKQVGNMANLAPSRFLAELGPSAPAPVAG